MKPPKCPLTREWTREDAEHTYKSIIRPLKRNNATCSNMEGPGSYRPKGRKSDRERQAPCAIAYMWNLEKVAPLISEVGKWRPGKGSNLFHSQVAAEPSSQCCFHLSLKTGSLLFSSHYSFLLRPRLQPALPLSGLQWGARLRRGGQPPFLLDGVSSKPRGPGVSVVTASDGSFLAHPWCSPIPMQTEV